MRPPSAIWLYRKPVGVTSFSLVEAFRQGKTGPLKVSHGGVLDPFAQGLVLLLVGSANRLFEFLHEAPKRYVARVEWGQETETGDAAGRVVHTGDATALKVEALEAALPGFVGWHAQRPPATSNKRVDGERAYVRAHRGETVELPEQQVYLHSAAWLRHELPRWSEVELWVRGGFYVRSFAIDLGRRLGVGAHLSFLERTHHGPWACPSAGAEPVMVKGRDVLPWLPSRELSDAELGALRAGTPLADTRLEPPSAPVPAGFPPPSAVRCFHQGRLMAVTRSGGVVLLPGGV